MWFLLGIFSAMWTLFVFICMWQFLLSRLQNYKKKTVGFSSCKRETPICSYPTALRVLIASRQRERVVGNGKVNYETENFAIILIDLLVFFIHFLSIVRRKELLPVGKWPAETAVETSGLRLTLWKGTLSAATIWLDL